MIVLFSIVIPTYNRGHLLPHTLESVWQQTLGEYEVIVVDDGSTDGTRDQLNCLGNRIRYLSQSNRGPGAARNLGMQEAGGEYVAFLDSDDLWFPWTLATFAHLIREYDEPAILGARLVEFSDPQQLHGVQPAPPRGEFYSDYFSSSAAGYFVGSGMAVLRRDCLLASGGFTEDRENAEDHDLILRLGTAMGFVQVLDPVTLAWRRHPGSETDNAGSTAAGVLRLVRNERQGVYPGDVARGGERRQILTGHARPASLGCLRGGSVADAWRVYWATWRWHLAQRRLRFLVCFPLLALLASLRRIGTERQS